MNEEDVGRVAEPHKTFLYSLFSFLYHFITNFYIKFFLFLFHINFVKLVFSGKILTKIQITSLGQLLIS
jgi:hypothetical protein